MFHVQLPQLQTRWTPRASTESLSEKAEDLSISMCLTKWGNQRAFNRRAKSGLGGVSAALTVLTEHTAGHHTAAGLAPWDGFACPATASATSTVSVTRERDVWWVTATLPCLGMERGAHPWC